MRVRISGFDAARVSPRNQPNSRRLSRETLEWILLSATERDGLEIWHPYALLHYLKKPVDLLTVNADEHVITGSGRGRRVPGASVEVLDALPHAANGSSYAIFEGQPHSQWNDSPTLS